MAGDVSITAVRKHASTLWEAVLKARLPPTWLPVPVRRALMEAVVVSIYALLTSNPRRVRINHAYEAARLIGLDDPDGELAPRPGESAAEWWARVSRRRSDETANEWIGRVSILAMAILPYIITMSAPIEDKISAVEEEMASGEMLL